MRTSRAILVTSLLATVALAGCTSGTEGPDEDDTATQTDELEGSIPEGDWWCRMFDEQLVATATEGRTAEAREVLRKNDAEGWQCEVVLPVGDGPETEEILTLTIEVNASESADSWRQRSEEAGAEVGPDYLGEAHIAPGSAVAILPCGAPTGSELAGSLVPYVVSVVAHTPSGQGMTQELVAPLRRTVVDLDQTTGCSPSRAERPAGETPDDAEQTSGSRG